MSTLPSERVPRKPIVALALACALVTAACQERPTTPDLGPQPQALSASMMNSNAQFRTWHQGFNHGIEGWIDGSIQGFDGWCGTIAARDRSSDMVPSAGRGFAVVSAGACNDFWITNGFAASGPYSPGSGYSTVFPPGGYVMDLDIYLDPDASPATTFLKAISFVPLDVGGLRYFLVPVTQSNGSLLVSGYEVTQAGWYRFRHVFGDDGGNLAVRFELARAHGPTLFAQDQTTTAFTGEPTSSFASSSVGSGYIWFVDIAAGLELAIDEHKVHSGG